MLGRRQQEEREAMGWEERKDVTDREVGYLTLSKPQFIPMDRN